MCSEAEHKVVHGTGAFRGLTGDGKCGKFEGRVPNRGRAPGVGGEVEEELGDDGGNGAGRMRLDA